MEQGFLKLLICFNIKILNKWGQLLDVRWEQASTLARVHLFIVVMNLKMGPNCTGTRVKQRLTVQGGSV